VVSYVVPQRYWRDLKYHASHYDHSAIFHVSAIQKDALLSRHNLLRCDDCLWSTHRRHKQRYSRRYALIIVKDLSSLDKIPEELVLSGTYQCADTFKGNAQLLITETWILVTVWEVLALSLAIWIVIRHLHELRRSSQGWTIRDCFAVLIKTHVLYFATWARDSIDCFSVEAEILSALL